MSKHGEPIDWTPRTAVHNRVFVYVLPYLGEDLTKVGFTRDPMQRFRSFHARFFTQFDLERGMLVETATVREARRLERLLIERWPEHRAPAPLVISEAAGGHTEWFRGIEAEVGPFVLRVAERYGYICHAPLSGWLRAYFTARADQLYDWAERMLAMVQWQAANVPPAMADPRFARALIDSLDVCRAVGMELSRLVPAEVLAWYERERG